MKIYLLNGNKVWYDEATAPAEAIPYKAPKKRPAPPVKTEEKPKAEEPKAKAKATTANKARRAGGNK